MRGVVGNKVKKKGKNEEYVPCLFLVVPKAWSLSHERREREKRELLAKYRSGRSGRRWLVSSGG